MTGYLSARTAIVTADSVVLASRLPMSSQSGHEYTVFRKVAIRLVRRMDRSYYDSRESAPARPIGWFTDRHHS